MEFTRHASQRCKLYKITTAEVEKLFADERSVQGFRRDGKPFVSGRVRGIVVTVVYVMENDKPVVISVWK